MPQKTKTSEPEKELMEFKLLAGVHVQDDLTQEPQEVRNPTTGEVKQKYPERTYKVGETIVSETDLAAKHGSTKFMKLGSGKRRTGPGNPGNNPVGPSVGAPGGQVIQGFQETTSGPDGTMVSGPEREDVAPMTTAKAHETHNTKADADEWRENEENVKSSKSDKADKSEDVEQTLEDKYGPLEECSVTDLQAIASEEGVDVKGLRKKEDLVKAIKASKG